MIKLMPDLAFQFKAIAALVALVLVGSAVRAKLTRKRRLPLPPGPPGHWLYGNDLPHANQSQQFASLVSQYGPVISLRLGSKVMIVIGRLRESVDIMEKENGLLADRPRSVAVGEILTQGLLMVIAPVGNLHRRLRRAAHTHLSPKAAESYQPIQTQAAKEVILDILNDPKQHQAHVKRYAASVILRVTYGKSTPTETNDPEIVTIHMMARRLQALMRPGAMLIEIFPFLKYLPFYASHIYTWHEEDAKFLGDKLSRVAAELNSGEAGPSFSRYLLENQNTHNLSHKEMAYLSGGLFAAGSGSTAVTITFIIMAAACYPEAQDVVQKELDGVIGRERAPTFDDYDDLPQLQAFILESNRWRPASTLGFAHRATGDVVYKDFCIPEGAIVYGNQWAIARDPEAFPDPENFDPQRWLNSNGKIRDDVKFPTFGFGRRACPGQHVAKRSVFINAALLLWSFRITQDPKSPIDQNGFEDGVVVQPAPFDACFTPRIADEAHLRDAMAKN